MTTTKPETPHYPAPAKGSLVIPNMDDLTGGELLRIKGAIGLDPINLMENGDMTELTMAIAWHIVSQRPEYKGITYQNVLDWPLTCLADQAPESADQDADSVREAAAELGGDPDDALVYGQAGDEIPFTGQSEPGSGSPGHGV